MACATDVFREAIEARETLRRAQAENESGSAPNVTTNARFSLTISSPFAA